MTDEAEAYSMTSDGRPSDQEAGLIVPVDERHIVVVGRVPVQLTGAHGITLTDPVALEQLSKIAASANFGAHILSAMTAPTLFRLDSISEQMLSGGAALMRSNGQILATIVDSSGKAVRQARLLHTTAVATTLPNLLQAVTVAIILHQIQVIRRTTQSTLRVASELRTQHNFERWVETEACLEILINEVHALDEDGRANPGQWEYVQQQMQEVQLVRALRTSRWVLERRAIEFSAQRTAKEQATWLTENAAELVSEIVALALSYEAWVLFHSLRLLHLESAHPTGYERTTQALFARITEQSDGIRRDHGAFLRGVRSIFQRAATSPGSQLFQILNRNTTRDSVQGAVKGIVQAIDAILNSGAYAQVQVSHKRPDRGSPVSSAPTLSSSAANGRIMKVATQHVVGQEKVLALVQGRGDANLTWWALTTDKLLHLEKVSTARAKVLVEIERGVFEKLNALEDSVELRGPGRAVELTTQDPKEAERLIRDAWWPSEGAPMITTAPASRDNAP